MKNKVIIILHLDEPICVLEELDIDKLCRILERDPIVDKAEFVNKVGSKLKFKINGNNNLELDVYYCDAEIDKKWETLLNIY